MSAASREWNETVGEFAHRKAMEAMAKVAAQTRQLVLMPPGQPESVEGIHQFRVSTRRFRAVLEAFPAEFPETGRRRIRRAIRKAFRASGEVRNRDITLGIVAPLELAGSGIARAKLQSERQVAEKDFTPILERWVAKDFVARWRARIEPHQPAPDGAPDAPAESVAQYARRTLPEYARAVFAAGRAAFEAGDAEALHEFRIAAKKFRYGLELFAPLYGPKFKKKLGQLKQLQDLLGTMNDLETARLLLENEPGAEEVVEELKRQSDSNRTEIARYWHDELAPQEQAWVRYYGRIVQPRVRPEPVETVEPPAVVAQDADAVSNAEVNVV